VVNPIESRGFFDGDEVWVIRVKPRLHTKTEQQKLALAEEKRMNRVSSARVVIVAMILALIASFAFAQSDLGSISGFVKDPSGGVVPKANVTVRNESTGVERRTTTNEAGVYTVTNIPAGLYRVTAEAAGFKKFESSGNKLDPSASPSTSR
jgi:hypothetical protein